MFDGNGNWTSDFSAQADRDNGIKILASRFDNIFITDIKESFENCLTKDGQIAPIGNFNMGGQKITNLNNGVNDNDAVNMSQLNNAVHKTCNENISGTKTFNADIYQKKANPRLYMYNTDCVKGTAPASTKSQALEFRDNNNNLLGAVYSAYYTDKRTAVRIITNRTNSSSDTEQAFLDVIYPASGAPYATAPASDVDGSIVTTVNKSKATNGYFKLGNGLIIQWGTVSGTGGTITLPTPFSNTNYGVTFTRSAASGTNDNDAITTRRTTSFDVTIYGSGGGNWIAIGY